MKMSKMDVAQQPHQSDGSGQLLRFVVLIQRDLEEVGMGILGALFCDRLTLLRILTQDLVDCSVVLFLL